MKIVFSNYDDIKNPFYGGGGAYAIHEIARRFSKKGHKVVVITGKYKGSKDVFVEKVKYKRIGFSWTGPKLSQLIYHLILPIFVKITNFDIWIESFTPPHSTSFLPLFTKKNVVGLVHMLASEDMRRKYKLPFHLVEKIGLRFYKHFIVLNDITEINIRKVNESANIKIIPNGIDIPQYISKKRRTHILFLGRIEINQKGLDLLLKAYKKVDSKKLVKMVIAGGGTESEVESLKSLIIKFGLKNNVEYVGKVIGRKKNNLFNKALFMVIPSRYETFSIVSLEAAAWGLPIICFDIEGLRWLPKNCALKIKPFSVDLFSKEMERLESDSRLRESLGNSARVYVRRYSWNDIFRKYEKFITQLV